MNMKKKVAMYLLGLIIMGIGFICNFYREASIGKYLGYGYGYEIIYVYPYQTMGIALVFIGIAIMVIWIVVDSLGWLDTT